MKKPTYQILTLACILIASFAALELKISSAESPSQEDDYWKRVVINTGAGKVLNLLDLKRDARKYLTEIEKQNLGAARVGFTVKLGSTNLVDVRHGSGLNRRVWVVSFDNDGDVVDYRTFVAKEGVSY